MQCREFFIMADLSDKYYTVSEYPKRYFIGQNAIVVKK